MTEWTDPETFAEVLSRVETREKGTYFEEFAEGETIRHEPGLVLRRHASELWAGATLNHDPVYWRPDAAAEYGYDEPPIHPDYLLASVMGPSVEDLSEKGGYFLGRDGVTLHEHGIYPGTAVRVESVVEAKRESGSRPDYGIVTWETTGYDAETDEPLLSYTRTNMVPRREPMATDGGSGPNASSGTGPDSDPDDPAAADEPAADQLPAEFVTPEGPYFEDFRDALDRAGEDAAVAYRHERGRTMDGTLVSTLPLVTLNTAKQHHDAAVMADSPSGDIVAYGDVTRSIALAHARSDERTYRELGYDDERFHRFVVPGDTVYGFTRLLDAEESDAPGVGEATFEHVAFNQRDEPVYSGTRTALIEARSRR